MEVNNDDFLALKVFTKAGAEFIIGEKKFVMKPLPLKKIEQLQNLFKSFTDDKSMDNDNFIGYLRNKLIDIFPIVFNEIVTQDFLNENISIPLIYELYEQFVELNIPKKLLPFFQDAIRIKAKPINQMI